MNFVPWLHLTCSGKAARATLRDSLREKPGEHIRSMQYIEPYLQKHPCSDWERAAHYLIAGLWAQYGPENPRKGNYLGIAVAKALSSRPTLEKYFIDFIESDKEQLPERLRSLLSLLRTTPPDYEDLLAGVCRWNKPVQIAWAMDFYRTKKG